jgi:hypothetical protein
MENEGNFEWHSGKMDHKTVSGSTYRRSILSSESTGCDEGKQDAQ